MSVAAVRRLGKLSHFRNGGGGGASNNEKDVTF